MSRARRPRSILPATALALGLSCLAGPGDATAELCWEYSDGTFGNRALTPISCVQQGDGVTPCSWNGNCHEDGDPSDCCTTVPAAAPQTVLKMHELWHQCFGNTGDSDGNNPPGRGQRWYAFHRQFEVDFNTWRQCTAGPPDCAPFTLPKVESLDWCPNMVLPYGHHGAGLSPGDHPDNCGIGPNRPAGVTCTQCEAFPHCLFVGGGGPIACPGAPSSVCQGNGVSFPCPGPTCREKLEDFQNVEEVTTILDDYFHGAMHGAIGFADGGTYNTDIDTSTCSARDPMFWRLHKALDDVVRAWQDVKAADVMVVLDRSGSMTGGVPSGGTKIDEAKDSAEMFADLLQIGRSDGQKNRIGIVSYSNNAASTPLNLPLTDADATLLNPGGPFLTTLNAISAGGATSIGSGIVKAVQGLCPPGNCSGYIPASGENTRKAILLLTDGMENVAPCLKTGCQGGSGAEIDYSTLDVTQICAVGLGNSSSLNGNLLTLLAERQGGIYMQNPSLTTSDDLKDFFVKCFGLLSDEFVGLDPKGSLAAGDPTSQPVLYTSLDDHKLTFASGWNKSVTPGDVKILVTTPSGDLVQSTDPAVEASDKRKWSFMRIPLPFHGESNGTWRAQLIRPHRVFVNGFTTDSFAVPAQGVTLVRRQIQRLCPDGCGNSVLYFEDLTIGGNSVYQAALAAEQTAATAITGFTTAVDANDFTAKLALPWNLIVFARQAIPATLGPYDDTLALLLCQGQRAIVTDMLRSVPPFGGNPLLECAGVQPGQSTNYTLIVGDGRLVDGSVALVNPGRTLFSYDMAPVGASAEAFWDPNHFFASIVAKAQTGVDLTWFMDVLVSGLSRLDVNNPPPLLATGADLFPSVRILPSFIRSGGYDNVDARVEITRPTIGLGTLLARNGIAAQGDTAGDGVDPRSSAVATLPIPTTTTTYQLYDDGTHGDLLPGNAYWSRLVQGGAAVDGLYQYHFILDLTSQGVTTRRELFQSVHVDVDVDPNASATTVTEQEWVGVGDRTFDVRIYAKDRFGNLFGPGRQPQISCGPPGSCSCDPSLVVDEGNGGYRFEVTIPPGGSLAGCKVGGFGKSSFAGLPLPRDIPALDAVPGMILVVLLLTSGALLLARRRSTPR